MPRSPGKLLEKMASEGSTKAISTFDDRHVARSCEWLLSGGYVSTRALEAGTAVGDAASGVLIIVENLPVPVDRRVWQEATTLHQAGYTVSVICPKGQGYDKAYEQMDGVHIYRHRRGVEGSGAVTYLLEYAGALFWEFVLSLKVAHRHGFDVLHACNPPDLIFLIAAPFKLLGTKFVFNHHDVCPELYSAIAI